LQRHISDKDVEPLDRGLRGRRETVLVARFARQRGDSDDLGLAVAGDKVGDGDKGNFDRPVRLCRCFVEPLLDDGFQHRSLARAFDVVLITPEDIRDRLLPAGRLREPLTSLRRADAVVLTSGASKDSLPLEGMLDGKLVWRVRRGFMPVEVPPRPVVFCGIARPKNFVLQLRTAGIEPVAEAFYRDHHAYSERDVRDLLDLKKRSEADGFVTTEKDAVNLGGFLSALEPLAVVPVKMELTEAANAVDTMLARIAGGTARA